MEKIRYKFEFNRRKVLNKNDEAPIELRLTYKRKKLYLSSGFYIKENQWNDTKSEVNANLKNFKQVNTFLWNLKNRIENFELEFSQSGKDFNLDLIKEFGSI